MSLDTHNWLADYLRDNRTNFLKWDIKIARVLGAPQGWTISGHAWTLESKRKFLGKILRPLIDWLYLKIFEQQSHCFKAWLKDKAKETQKL